MLSFRYFRARGIMGRITFMPTHFLTEEFPCFHHRAMLVPWARTDDWTHQNASRIVPPCPAGRPQDKWPLSPTEKFRLTSIHYNNRTISTVNVNGVVRGDLGRKSRRSSQGVKHACSFVEVYGEVYDCLEKVASALSTDSFCAVSWFAVPRIGAERHHRWNRYRPIGLRNCQCENYGYTGGNQSGTYVYHKRIGPVCSG